jgi:hypothetical protein
MRIYGRMTKTKHVLKRKPPKDNGSTLTLSVTLSQTKLRAIQASIDRFFNNPDQVRVLMSLLNEQLARASKRKERRTRAV